MRFILHKARKTRFLRIKSKRKGLLTKLLTFVRPFVSIADKLGLRFIVDFLATQLVYAYQKYLSPLKSFSCAHSKLYGTKSCSEYFRRVVRDYGLVKAIPLFEQRLKECKLASITLRTQYFDKR
jgi:putative component of membrane protein insertase Oxa1/YidC/SpoIIIJ protein YidD